MIGPLLRELAETAQKPGIMSLVGIRRERLCTRDMETYFRLLKKTLPIETLSQLATSGNKEAALHQSEIIVRRVIRQIQPALLSILTSHKMLAWKEGYKTAQVVEDRSLLKEAAKPITPKGKPLDQLGPGGQRAADYAATSAGEKIKGINQTTLGKIQDAIAEGIEEQLGVPGTAKLLRDTVDGMTVQRSLDIATTEMTDAFSQATLAKLNDLGIEYKKSIPVDDPCDDCQENADAGAIPVDDEFPSGDDASPFHTRCRCATVGARSPESD
jgi:hypothetical protein